VQTVAVDGGAPAASGWSDSSARALLQLMAESVAEMVGFEIAVLCVVLDDQLVTVAYHGPEELRDFVHEPDPASVLDPVLARGTPWGRFVFLAAESYDREELDGHWVVFTKPGRSRLPDAWRPGDELIGFLRDDDGRLVGSLSLDRPVSGRRPDEAQRRLLERYASQAERAVITAFEREAMVQQIAHAESARRLIRSASMPSRSSLRAVLEHTHLPLVEGFNASGSWIQVLDTEGPSVGYSRGRESGLVELDDALVALAGEIAPLLWRDQRVVVATADGTPAPPGTDIGDAVRPAAARQLAEHDLVSALAVPLGAGSECVGFLVLTRVAGKPPWSAAEAGSALEIGHDLGAALITARALERERNLVRELQQLDDYRSQLIATLSHELRTPLTVILGNLEMLGELELEEAARRYHQAMSRGTHRMRKVVDDLLLLAQVSDPQHPLVRVPVDLHVVAHDVVALVESAAVSKGVALQVDLGPEELIVPGDPGELDQVLGNLASNAVKYTPAGGTVSVTGSRRGDAVVLAVADDGLGISEEDQRGLFRAFFRTTNPEALREPGTGLGLAIVATIVERHRGTVTVDSELGRGTTFTVTLPAPVGG